MGPHYARGADRMTIGDLFATERELPIADRSPGRRFSAIGNWKFGNWQSKTPVR
jgi:hypothetical protein